ncbi:PREDICTED: uncharacterized protein LOC109340568, partial [Lupinus angustifolius]|uniref:uncharacterized protein LOC109340568 n=1 Tax=Lupinus angustifolius TaxID=3871 RepID=UPI00092F08DC
MVKEELEDKEDENPVLLMMITDQKDTSEEVWYIDSGCSNHMTGHRDWLVNFNPNKRSKVRFADNRLIQAEGTGDVVIRRNDGKKAMLTDVLFVPNMKNNLISLGQLIEKGFSVKMQSGYLEVLDSSARKVMKVPLTQNITFQVTLNAIESQCLNVELLSNDSWLWHMRLGHLNFKDLSLMKSKEMVSGLPSIQIPKK